MSITWNKRLILFSIILFIGGVGLSTEVEATDIRTDLCDSTSGPSVLITSPASDSVVNISNTRLQGTATRTTQIDIYVNGSYSSSLALGPSGSIDTTLSLPEGTNTIALSAYYSCNQTSSVTNIVVTYEPAATPSTGSTTDTTLPPGTISAGTRDRSTPPSEAALPTPPAEPVAGYGQPIKPFDASPDKEAPGDENISRTPNRLWLVLALLTALITPTIFLLGMEKFARIFGLAGLRFPRKIRWSIRGSGLLAAVLLAILLSGVVGNV